jgi:GDSL-like lipase/acylhydrolase family protein
MSRIALPGRVAALCGLTVLATACYPDTKIFTTQATDQNSVLARYAALGNSITAGYQAGGIVDSTQRESYAFFFAQQAKTRYGYASLAKPGCPPPYSSFLAQTRPTGTTGTTCALRANSTALLNNVAVPGATSVDPTAATSPFSNTLTTLILGGETQVQKALDIDPTFITAWIGNNDVLPSVAGDAASVAAITSTATFITNYKKMADALQAAPHLLGGVLFGVVDVVNVPQLFSATQLASPTNQALINAAAGTTVIIHPNCSTAPGNQSLINLNIVRAIRGQQHPPVIACVAGTPVTLPNGAVVNIGDALVVDATEQATISARVASYNAYIKAKADTMHFVYINPNPLLAALRAAGTIPAFPNPTLPNPFGAFISPDGIHPARQAHQTIANVLIDSVNVHWSMALPKVTVQ